MAIVYRHIRPDKDEVFYIGIGKTEERSESIYNRNPHWKNIVIKNNDIYKIDVLFEDLTWKEACKKEIEFIKLYGRSDLGLGTLCNMTNGGDGILGYKHTKESKEKIGFSSRNISEETRKKRSVSLSGKNNPNYNKPLPEWHKEINRLAQTGRKQSKETIAKRVEKLTGQKRNFPEESKKSIKERMSKKVINTVTGNIYISINEAALSENITRSSLGAKLRGECRNNTNLKFLNP